MAQLNLDQPDLPAEVGLTVVGAAGARAAENARDDRLFVDELAAAFVAAAGAVPPSPELLTEHGEQGWGPMGNLLAVRTRFFDDYLRAATGAGVGQVVLLGAGLDTRPFRMEWPESTHVFEVDAPPVLAFKERVLGVAGVSTRCARTDVPADLRGDWGTALVAAGFRPDQPTAWLAEGLIVYLGHGGTDHLAYDIESLSAPGSRLGLEYLDEPTLAALGGTTFPATELPTPAQARLEHRSQPHEDLQMWLTRHGWDTDVRDVASAAEDYDRKLSGPLASGDEAGAWLITAERSGSRAE